ncbi:MAG: mannose-1-phosphate guanylyltransferase [Psychroflexus maritimus]
MKKNANYYAILMAGGVGSRFWPVSKATYPKQFHDMLGTGKSLLQSTFSRLQKIIPTENIFILTNANYQALVQKQLPEITERQLVLEPAMRNTAPCILLASLKIYKENPNALMAVAPSDHWIEDEEAFTSNLQMSFDACQRQSILMTLGIQPSFPNTGYGYIKFLENDKSPIKAVEKFTEKPDYLTAKKFLQEGNYTWNAGIFIWSAKAILEAFEQHQPSMKSLFAKGYEALNTSAENKFLTSEYSKAENISIDYAILEKASNIYMLTASFDWNDLGTWGSLYEQLPKNEQENVVINSNQLIEINSSENIVRTSTNKLVVLEGLKKYMVIETEDELVIVSKEKEQDIKQIRRAAIEKYGKQFE